MLPPAKHIILIGFKHVGKSRLGRVLATKLNKKFIDLDQQIEIIYAKHYLQKTNCRQIMRRHGQDFFRELESKVLQCVIKSPPAVIALGGGAALNANNHHLLTAHTVVYVTAQPKIVFQRIMVKGLPAFFAKQDDPWLAFNKLWQEREAVYQSLAEITVDNSGEFANAVKQLSLNFQ